MSYDGISVGAALEAVVACERLASQLPELAAWLDYAASVARTDWTGPHRDAFDERVAVIGRALLQASGTLRMLRTRVDEAIDAH